MDHPSHTHLCLLPWCAVLSIWFAPYSCSCLDSKAWYTLYITTTDIRGAGTDADVHIALSGSQGSSGVVALPSQLQQYQRGQRDKFRCVMSNMFCVQT